MKPGARLLAAAALLFLSIAAGCSAAPSGRIVVQAPVAPATAPLLVMQEAGWSPGGGAVMDLIIYKTVEEATTRVMKGQADFTILPVNVAAKLYNKGVPVKLANVSTWGLLYLVSGDPGVKRLTDLRGRELYVGARGATPDILTRCLLAQNGIGEGEVDIKYAQSPEIARMIVGGLARTAVLPEPLVTQVTAKKPSVRVVADFYTEWKQAAGEDIALPQAGMVVKNDFLNSKPREFEAFLGEYRNRLAEVVAGPEKAAPLVEKHLGFSMEVFSATMARTRLKYEDGYSVRRDVGAYLSRLNEYSPETVGGKVPDDQFFVQR